MEKYFHGKCRKLAIVIAFVMLITLPAGQAYALGPGGGIFTGRSQKETETEPATERGEDQTPADTPKQLTAEDIEEMNNGDVAMLFSEDGFLTFLRGKYYEGKVTNEEEAIESLFGIQSLLGLSKGSEFYCVYGERNMFGYTYYTYLQRYGDMTLRNAVLKVIIDPDGYTAGVVSSFTPNVGIAPSDEDAITAEEAIQIVRDVVEKEYPEQTLQFYPEDTRQTSITYDDVAYHAWAVFTDYPEVEGYEGDRGFLEHLVAYDGEYLKCLAVNSTKELVVGYDVDTALALSWFEGKEADTYTGTVTLHDGTKEEITVPVVRDTETGIYYLADIQRHFLVADYYDYLVYDKYTTYSSEDNTLWPEHYLITYANYIKVYDFYDSFGLTSVDGFGMPILILTNYCNGWHEPIDNAAFCGFLNGWALFGASEVNDYGECIDVLGHEYTHAVTNFIRQGDLYENESGALNEATSDIMGNLCEMILGETTDTEWLIAENSGNPIRSMSFPWLYNQPVTVGGELYHPIGRFPSSANDFGGIHTNSSLVNHVAWQLCSQGLSLVDSFYLWKEALNFITPLSGFREIHQALLFAGEVLQMDVAVMVLINMLCEEAGY